ncbi:MAG: hypothetical protein ABI999_01335 [Acidobacteriota bacterium]
MIKNIIWWSYERASWQWDVLCILIMCFIFLTPKTWFEKDDRFATQEPVIGVQIAENHSGDAHVDVNSCPAGN